MTKMTMLAICVVVLLVSETRGSNPGNDSNTCPAMCQCSNDLAIVNCRGKGLAMVPKGIPIQVVELNLDNNHLTILQNGDLANLSLLTTLYLRNNKIDTLELMAFQNLSRIQNLYLTNNKIQNLTPEVFQGVSSLTYLSLDSNYLTSLPDLGYLRQLKILSVSANRIQDATFPASFANLTAIDRIVLSNNKITKLANDTFTSLGNSSLHKLEITRNQIHEISPGALLPLRTLDSLNIGYNPLDAKQLYSMLQGLQNDTNLKSLDIRTIQLEGVLPSGSFSILSGTPLNTLIFKNNSVNTIPPKAFANLTKLVHLDLSACQVQTIHPTAFQVLPGLQDLFLNDNVLLNDVPSNLPPSLMFLYLQGNNIQTLRDNAFQKLRNLRVLFLNQNKITQVNENSMTDLSNLKILQLADNKISYFPKNFFAPLTSLTSLNLRNNNLRSLKLNPGVLSSMTALTSLDLSSNQCSFMPYDYLHDLTSLQNLNLANNNLNGMFASDSDGVFLAEMSKLENLNLSNNHLEIIHDAELRNLDMLRNLDLSNNHLSFWGPELFKTAGSSLQSLDLSNNLVALVNETSVRDLTQLQMLNLSLNPFACTCDLRWFRSWLDNTTVRVANKENYRCTSPPEWSGKSLMTFGAEKINCKNYLWYYVGGAAVIAVLLSVVSLTLGYRYRWFIRLRLYRFKKRIRGNNAGREGYQPICGQDKQFDFYVIASDKEHVWVRENLLPRLDNGLTGHAQDERHQGPFRLYFEPRDANNPGKNEIEIYDEDIQTCKAALVVLTPNLIDDRWCELKLQVAEELKMSGELERIFIVKVGRLKNKHIPKRLQKAVEKRDFLEWLNKETMEQDFVDRLRDELRLNQRQVHPHVQNV